MISIKNGRQILASIFVFLCAFGLVVGCQSHGKKVTASVPDIYKVVASTYQELIPATNGIPQYWVITYGDTNTCVFNDHLNAKHFENDQTTQCSNGTSYSILFIKWSDILNH